MKKISLSVFLLTVFFFLTTAFTVEQTDKYKCMVQLVNYTGEGAYVIVSVLDQDDNYVKTLRVIGDDKEWYPDLEQWYAFHERTEEDIDGITGATISGGERTMFGLEVDAEYVGKNNKLRFETAVEDQKYVKDDIILPLTEATLSGKYEGSDYIRYIKLLGK